MFSTNNGNLQPILLTNNRRSDNNSTILFTNARDEPNIAEWVAHHLLLGFDKVIIFDHLSTIPIETTVNTNFNGKLDIIKVDGSGNVKLKLMQRAINIASKYNYSWMLYLDADEFLNLNKCKHVKQFLEMFRQADAIGINWLMFGTSGHRKQPKGLLTNNFINSELRLNKHVKSFVRPSVAVKVVNPHFYIIVNPKRYYSCNRTRMGMQPFNEQPLPFINSYAYIAHYYTQSEEEHIRRKSRNLDDGTSDKTSMFPEIHKVYNEVINNQLQNKYSTNIQELLKANNIEL
jgi:hypothetical protein